MPKRKKRKWKVGSYVMRRLSAWEVTKVYDNGFVEIFDGIVHDTVPEDDSDIFPFTWPYRAAGLMFHTYREKLPDVWTLNWSGIDEWLAERFTRMCRNIADHALCLDIQEEVEAFIKSFTSAVVTYDPKREVQGVKVWFNPS